MKLNRAILSPGTKHHFFEDVDFTDFKGDPHHCRRIDSCHVDIDVIDLNDILNVSIKGKAEIITSCKYTLEDVPLTIHFADELSFTDNEDDSSCYYEPSTEIDLNPYILALILDKVPHTAVKPGATIPKSGDGFRVLTEEELNEERKNKKDPRWDVLDQIKL